MILLLTIPFRYARDHEFLPVSPDGPLPHRFLLPVLTPKNVTRRRCAVSPGSSFSYRARTNSSVPREIAFFSLLAAAVRDLSIF